MIDLAQDLLGTDDVRLYLAIATAKFAGQPSEYNLLLHTDFPNHTLTVPRAEAGYHQMETFIYLTDVGPHNGATRFVSRARTRHDPRGEHTLNFEDHGDLYDEPGDASAPAGSIVAYRPDVYHRSVDFTDPRSGALHAPRVVQARRDGMGWLPGVAVQGLLGGVAQLRPAGHAPAVDGPGIPRPGHPSGPTTPWPAWPVVTRGWTSPPGRAAHPRTSLSARPVGSAVWWAEGTYVRPRLLFASHRWT